jgi:hypothetical protein
MVSPSKQDRPRGRRAVVEPLSVRSAFLDHRYDLAGFGSQRSTFFENSVLPSMMTSNTPPPPGVSGINTELISPPDRRP